MEQVIDTSGIAWQNLLTEIAARYSDGTIIPHDWLKHKFGLEDLRLEDYATVDDFLEGNKLQQFAYMSLIDRLRWQLLEREKMYLKNEKGEGYYILNPKDQTTYGYDEMVRTIKTAIRQASLIMNNVLAVPSEQQSKDNDLRAKFGILKSLMANFKRERGKGWSRANNDTNDIEDDTEVI